MKQCEVAWVGHSAEIDATMVSELMDATGTNSFSELLFQLLMYAYPSHC